MFLTYTISAILLISSMSAQVSKPYDYSEKNWKGECITGKRQSPINFPSFHNYTESDYFKIISTDYKIIKDLKFVKEPFEQKHYNIANMTSEYGTIMAKKGNITYKYNLTDVHFHTLSEHTFEGFSYGAEMHMIHKKDREWLAANNITETTEDKVNDYLVVGIVFSNRYFSGYPSIRFSGYPNNTDFERMNLGTGKNIDGLDLKVFSRPDTSYYHYIGGMTTPDCGEVVNWVVYYNPVKISALQYNELRNWINPVYPNGNAREVKVLNNRTIYKIKGENSQSVDELCNSQKLELEKCIRENYKKYWQEKCKDQNDLLEKCKNKHSGNALIYVIVGVVVVLVIIFTFGFLRYSKRKKVSEFDTQLNAQN